MSLRESENMSVREVEIELEDLMTSTQHVSRPLDEVAINELLEVIGDDDEQAKLVVELLAQATYYSSSTMKERIKMRARAIKIAGKLFQEIRKELGRYKDLNEQLIKLINDFVDNVRDYQREINEARGALDLQRVQLEIIIDELVDDEHPLHYSAEEINRCVDYIGSVISPVTTCSNSVGKQLTALQTKVNQFRCTVVEPAKEKTIERAKTAKMIKRAVVATGTGAVGGLAAGGIVVSAPILGGVGAAVVAGVAFPPWGAVLITIGGGALIIGGIGLLISRLVKNYGAFRTRAVQYLEWLEKLCINLHNDIDNLKTLSHTIQIGSSNLQTQLNAVKFSLSSEKQRKKNSAIFKQAKKSLGDVYTSLQEIMEIDMTQWTDSKRLPTTKLLSLGNSQRP